MYYRARGAPSHAVAASQPGTEARKTAQPAGRRRGCALTHSARHPPRAGRICLDILKDKWSPALQVRTVLLSIQALLSAPNPEDPLDASVADHWKSNEAAAIAEGARGARCAGWRARRRAAPRPRALIGAALCPRCRARSKEVDGQIRDDAKPVTRLDARARWPTPVGMGVSEHHRGRVHRPRIHDRALAGNPTGGPDLSREPGLSLPGCTSRVLLAPPPGRLRAGCHFRTPRPKF